MMSSGGMQLESSSYSLLRILRSCLGDCSCSTSSAMAPMYSCQSGRLIRWLSLKGYCCTLQASSVSNARRKFRSHASEIRMASGGGSFNPSLCATWLSTVQISSCDGAAMRMQTQRERMGAITLHGLVQQRSSLHVPMYFSMVRRSACCAGLLSRSTSFRTTILKPAVASAAVAITGADCAISLITSCTTSRSRMPASDGFSSM
mmetsp:Transcript_25927/g.58908  ORF Transcript_25927/g.58908 Transcript_25927/m.58908 type:complete len:204 (-) Transcript_25927:285-896(-)